MVGDSITNSQPSLGKPITSYEQLVCKLAKLDSPAPGRKRVFRGQTKYSGKMLPRGLRGKPIRNEALWLIYSMAIAQDLHFLLQIPEPDSDLDMLTYGVWSIAQHYGAGSSFLDVSYSLDIALWFALHDAEEVKGSEELPKRFRGDLREDWEAIKAVWVKHSLWKDTFGFLYVFDVPQWTGEGYPAHGELVDLLSEALPLVLRLSERIRVQQACLLAADPNTNGGDLQRFYACEPIPVKWPMDGAPRLDAPVEEIFPSPLSDPWYDRFISIPSAHQVDPETQTVASGRPFSVNIYLPRDPGRLIDTVTRLCAVRPTRSAFSGLPEAFNEVSKEAFAWLEVSPPMAPTNCRFGDATPILLETPAVVSSFPVNSGMWNHDILHSDVAESIEAYDLKTKLGCGSVSLMNIFVEFSPLEQVGWERKECPAGRRHELPTSLWLVRHGARFFVYFFYQAWPRTKLRISGPVYYEFDAQRKKFVLCFPHQGGKVKEAGKAWSDQSVFVILNLLRALSPGQKVEPVPALVVEEGREIKIGVKIQQGANARLMRAAEAGADRYWYVVRDVKSDEPYLSALLYLPIASVPGELIRSKGGPETEPLKLQAADFVFRSDVPWSDVDAASIYRSFAKDRD